MTDSQTQKVISAISHLIDTSNPFSLTITEILEHPEVKYEVIVQFEKKVQQIVLNHVYTAVDCVDTSGCDTGVIVRMGPKAIAQHLRR